MGGRGADPPLPDEGAGRAAADLPAVLRALHPDGPRRQLHPDRREAEVPRQAGRPVRRHARLPGPPPRGPRRRRLRRGRGEHAVAPSRGLPDPRARGREHPRHPARDQGADGPAAALAAGRGPRGHGAGLHARPLARCGDRDPHPREPRQLGDPAGGRRGQGDVRGRRARRTQPGSAAQRRQRRPARAARPVLPPARRRADHALLLLHVRHDPGLGALAGLGRRRPAAAAPHDGLPARLRDAADRV